MNDVSHQVIRAEERILTNSQDISELKGSVKDLLEVSRNLSHAVETLSKHNTDEKVVERLKVLETAFDRAKFVWQVAFTVVTTPILLYSVYHVVGALQAVK